MCCCGVYLTICSRKKTYWDDGVEFTADDVAYTLNMWLETDGLAIHGWAVDYLAGVEVVDKYTLTINTTRSQPRFAKDLGVTIWGNRLYPMPKHVWEKEDPVTYSFFPPVCIGQYKYKDHDPNGNWTIWELREDWERTSVGQITAEHGPKYVMWNFVGTEEKRILAMINHDIDILQDITPESMEVLTQRSETARAWHAGFPYADFDDPCERGISFNNSEFSYDQWQVRWALALATDIKNVSLATFGGMLRVSPLAVPPVAAVQNTYHKPLVEQLKAMTLPDGYAPFDPNFATDMAEMFKQQGIADNLSASPEELVDLFEVGLKIVVVEILPFVLGWALANFINTILVAISAESGLAILGLSSLKDATLGTMIYWAMQHLDRVHLHLAPGGLYIQEWCIEYAPSIQSESRWTEDSPLGEVGVSYSRQQHSAINQSFEERFDLTLNGEPVASTNEIVYVRYPNEFALLLQCRSTQWEMVGCYNRWDLDTPLTDAQEINRPLCILRRKDQ